MTVTFGDEVRAHRRRLGLSQQELAQRAGLSPRTLRNIEGTRTDVPRPATVRLLADTFGLTGTERDRFCRMAADPVAPGPGAPDSPTSRSGPIGATVPAQLPPDVPGFVGREAVLRRMDDLARTPGRQESAATILVVTGAAGIGKTALTVHWAHRVRDLFPDGQLFLNLHGFCHGRPPVEPADAVRSLLEALGATEASIPGTADARAALGRSLLADRRTLIVVDNVHDVAQVRPLLPAAAGSLVVVTGRRRLAGLVALDGAHPVAIDVLAADEARRLLTDRLGPDRAAAEPNAVTAILDACAGLPLALVIVAARIAVRARLTLAEVAAQLRDPTVGLDALAVGDDPYSDVRTAFARTYTDLGDAEAALFRYAGLHAGTHLDLGSAAALSGGTPADARVALESLADLHLVGEFDRNRYDLHPLVRRYAHERALAHDSAAVRRAAVRRVFNHYLRTAHAATVAVGPDPLPGPLTDQALAATTGRRAQRRRRRRRRARVPPPGRRDPGRPEAHPAQPGPPTGGDAAARGLANRSGVRAAQLVENRRRPARPARRPHQLAFVRPSPRRIWANVLPSLSSV